MQQLEEQILRATYDLLQCYNEELAAAGRTHSRPEIEVRSREEATYSSELTIMFFKDGRFEDILEFHVFEGGAPAITMKKATDWLRAEIKQIARKRGRENTGSDATVRL